MRRFITTIHGGATMRGGLVAVFALATGVLSSCASLPPDQVPAHYLTFENNSSDVARVYLQTVGFPVLLGRVDPMHMERLRVPTGLLHSSAPSRIIVRIGYGVSTVFESEFSYSTDLLARRWRLSTNRLLPAGLVSPR